MAIFTDEVVVTATPGLSDAELRATPVPISGTVTATGPLTDTQLRASAVPVSGPLTDTQLRATPVPVTSTPLQSSSSTVSQVVLTANTNATLLAANANRVGVTLFIPGSPAWIKFGATASSTSFSIKVTANNTQLTKQEFEGWVGRVDIISQNGQTVTVTEY